MLILMAAAAALMIPDDDAPRRTDVDYRTGQSLIDLQTCITRLWMRNGRITPLPLQGGVALDWQMRSVGFGGPGKALMTFEIYDLGTERRVTIAYRRPWSAKNAVGALADTAKRCDFLPSVSTLPEGPSSAPS